MFFFCLIPIPKKKKQRSKFPFQSFPSLFFLLLRPTQSKTQIFFFFNSKSHRPAAPPSPIALPLSLSRPRFVIYRGYDIPKEENIYLPSVGGSFKSQANYFSSHFCCEKEFEILSKQSIQLRPSIYLMATPDKVLFRRKFSRKTPSSASTPSKTTVGTSYLNQVVFLYEWWLVKADPDFHGRRLGIGGFTSPEKQGIKSFLSSPVIKRHDTVTLETVDGITIMVHGQLSRSRTLENGFPNKVYDHFVFGFPYDWEEFSALSFSGDETPAPAQGSAMLKNIFDDILQRNNDDASLHVKAPTLSKETFTHMKTTAPTPDETPSNHKRKKAYQKRSVSYKAEDGPLTRSKTRLLDRI